MTISDLVKRDLFLGHVFPDLAHNIRDTFSGRRPLRFDKGKGKMPYTPKKIKFSPGVQSRTTPTKFRAQLGRPIGKWSTRRHTHYTSFTRGEADRELSAHRLINVPWSEEESQINKRRGNLVAVKGVKLRMQFQIDRALASTELGLDFPLEFRWAIINPKDNDGLTVTNQFDDQFWITKNPNEQMADSFRTTDNYWVYQTNTINREKYGVIKEGRFSISPIILSQEGQFALMKKMNHTIETYIPINKQMKFDANSTGATAAWPEQNVYFVYWYTTMNDLGEIQLFDNTATKTVPFYHKWEATTYFKNSQMYA